VRIGLASDHIGFEHKEGLKARTTRQGHSAEQLSAGLAGRAGSHGITDRLASAIRRGRAERGVLIGSATIGASALATKQRGVRAAVCHDLYPARACEMATGKTYAGDSEGNAGVC